MGRRWAAVLVWVVIASSGSAASAAEVRPVPGLDGAAAIRFEMPFDGQASIGLYTAEGRLVRPLAQLVDLERGPWEARWDGLDLWGNLVPAGTKLTAKVISNPGLKAYYEFTVGHANPTPWLTKPTGEGDAMRTGGWLGDHTPPSAAVAVGDRVFLRCGVAEHGHALIAVNLEGEKLWGTNGLEGWQGPRILATDGEAVYGPAGKGSAHVYRIDAATFERKQIVDTGKNPVTALAAHGGRVYLVMRNHEAERSAFLPALGKAQIDFEGSRPIVPPGPANHSKQISPRDQFANIFYDGRHWQTGVKAVNTASGAFLFVKFAEPVRIGTVVLEPIKGVEAAEVLALAPGVKYEEAKHSPLAGMGPETLALNAAYVKVGQAPMDGGMAVLPAPKADLMSEALFVRLIPEGKPDNQWEPYVGMVRILENRIRRVDEGAKVILPEGVKAEEAPAGRVGWEFRTEAPVNEMFPANVVVDFGEARTFDGLALLNPANPIFAVDAFTGEGDPAEAGDASWEEIATYRASNSKRDGWATCLRRHNEVYVELDGPVTTRAVRLRVQMGYGGGVESMGRSKDDPFQVGCMDLALLKLVDEQEKPPAVLMTVHDAATGEELARSDDPSVAMETMASAADGTLYSVFEGKLCRSTIGTDGTVRHEVLNDKEIRRATDLAVSADRIAVGDAERGAVLLFDRSGKLVSVLGERGPRVRGKWDPQVIASPSGVAIDPRGKVWVAESQYSPKRVARFAPDGTCERQLFGPAEYGGGGYLDPDLSAFYYRSCDWKLDWDAGTAHLENLSDRPGDPQSPALTSGSFNYTKIGRAIHLNDRRYIVGDPGGQGTAGVVVCILEGRTWRPCAVMASAAGCRFLVGKDVWKAHWLAQDLSNKSFIWCDRNGDGDYQVEEVELFDNGEFGSRGPFSVPYWGAWLGPKLEFWGSQARLAPRRFTDAGVPIYEASDLQAVRYGDLAPAVYMASQTGSDLAKRGYGGASIVTHNGSQILEGQPYVIRPDGTLKGGRPERGPSDYIPPIAGRVLFQPLHFIGSAVTKSPVGEVAAMNGNHGQYFFVSAEDCLLVGEIFTGRQGSWGTGLSNARGTDVTDRSHGWEHFFGHFVKSTDGRYFAVGGHTFHAISRVEGLDDYRVEEVPVTVTAEALALNEKLRPILAARAEGLSGGSKGRRTLAVQTLKGRAPRFAFDGETDDWGGPEAMHPLVGEKDVKRQSGEETKNPAWFDVAWDEEALTIALYGMTPLGNDGDDPKYLFKTGFAIDLKCRAAANTKTGGVMEGDRRLVFGTHKGRWTAMLYDYVDPKVPEAEWEAFTSPVVTTRVARVRPLGAAEAEVRFREVRDLAVRAPEGKSVWSAEIRVPWATLGVKPEAKREVLFDIGVIEPDGSGGVERRTYWSNTANTSVSDVGVEASILPAAWGLLQLGAK